MSKENVYTIEMIFCQVIAFVGIKTSGHLLLSEAVPGNRLVFDALDRLVLVAEMPTNIYMGWHLSPIIVVMKSVHLTSNTIFN